MHNKISIMEDDTGFEGIRGASDVKLKYKFTLDHLEDRQKFLQLMINNNLTAQQMLEGIQKEIKDLEPWEK